MDKVVRLESPITIEYSETSGIFKVFEVSEKQHTRFDFTSKIGKVWEGDSHLIRIEDE